MNDRLPLVSIAIPVYNEADNLERLYSRLVALAHTMEDRCRLEFVFTDNHSEDDTWDRIKALAANDPRVRAIRFSRNYGFQRSILANYMHARGDAVMQIDADLQDPPELLEQFFARWQQGDQVIYGIRRKRPEAAWLRAFRRFGYWLIDRLAEHPIPRDVGDFRLVDRRVVEALKKVRSANPYLRGMIAGLGFRESGIEYDRESRVAGVSKFNLMQLIRLGLSGVFNHSLLPLRFATYAGALLLATTMVGALYYVAIKLMNPSLPQGLASIHILVLFGIGFQSLLLGILGEYLLRIYLLLRAEPVAVSEDAVNIANDELLC